MTRVGLISLGCPRNLVDSEIMLGLLKKGGVRITEDFEHCDAAVVNTCAFIQDAKQESIDLILQLIELKKKGKLKAIIVTGCLPQRYKTALKAELGEIDALLGTNDFTRITEVLKAVLKGRRFDRVTPAPSFLYNHEYARSLITPPHFVYIKLSEGCDNFCSYCVIPKIRGRLRSRSMASVLKEAKALCAKSRLSEINLVGQDITRYGVDRYGEPKLAQLLKRLCGAKAARWIRLLYTHPEHYTDALIDVVKNEPSICKYLDIPLQHINDRILKLMNRKTDKGHITELITRLRGKIPALALRTTFIVGFPSETEREFEELFNFIKDTKFERLGVFEYSREEGTRAYDFKGQIPDKVKKERFDRLMQLQQEVAREVNSRFLGRELEVLIDEINVGAPFMGAQEDRAATRAAPTRNNITYVGRTQYDAPEVDGNCFVRAKRRHKPGDFVRVNITDTLEYDLAGECFD